MRLRRDQPLSVLSQEVEATSWTYLGETTMDFLEAGQTADYNSTKGEVTITVIKPGLSKNKRNYPAALLKRSAGIFEGAKMFADHQTEAQRKAQPEGSVDRWVANIKKVWVESDGTVKATAVVIDPAFKAKLDKLNAAGMLNQMGVSIRAIGEAEDKVIDGQNCKEVTSLIACSSVDFVTYPGAGGRVEAMESALRLVESYKSLGLTEVQARLAAGLESAIVTSSATKLAESFAALGMTAKQAELAALDPSRR